MKKKHLCIIWLVLIVISLSTNMTNAQNLENYSIEELLNDVNSRRVEKPILFLNKQIIAIENNEIPFYDDEYVGYVSLLSTSYIINNQLYESDSLLSHAIDYLICQEKTSYLFSLNTAYGSLLMSLGNYDFASQHLEMATNQMRKQKMFNEDFAVVMSMLAVCHMNTNNIDLAVQEIDESINIMETIGKKNDGTKSIYYDSSLMGICQKAGAIFYEYGNIARSIEYTRKAYDLSKDDDYNISVFINSAKNLAIMDLNNNNYTSALSFLHEIEDLPMIDSERASLYLSILQAYYYLDMEDKCIEYTQLCNNFIIKNINEYYSSFPGTTIEDIWEEYSMQLKLNMNVLKKFPNNSLAAQMSYDNALFIKRLVYDRMATLRETAKSNPVLYSTIKDIKQFRSELFGGDTSFYELLYNKEKTLIEQLYLTNNNLSCNVYHWQDIVASLDDYEYAIELIPYSGWPQNENDSLDLRIGALILSNDASSPIFVDICSNDKLYDLYVNAISQRELGINNLYTFDNDLSLYNLIWAPIDFYVQSAKRIYISPVLALQNINLEYIPCPDNSYLIDKYDIRIVSSTAIVCDNKEMLSGFDTSLYGGIDYAGDMNNDTITTIRGLLNDYVNINDRGTFSYLSASNREVDEINNLLINDQYKSTLLKGGSANEISFRELDGSSPTILHLSTHGFYFVGSNSFDNYFKRLIPYTINDKDMTRTGLLLANANTSFNINNNPVLSDGVLTAEEISWMDLSNTQLVVLSACVTAIGQSLQEGFGGLPRAFKMAGVKHIIASLWNVSDEATADLMILFYNNLIRSKDPHNALIQAQRELSLRYPDPYYWASFIMLD